MRPTEPDMDRLAAALAALLLAWWQRRQEDDAAVVETAANGEEVRGADATVTRSSN